VSNNQWHEDQAIGERAMRKMEAEERRLVDDARELVLRTQNALDYWDLTPRERDLLCETNALLRRVAKP